MKRTIFGVVCTAALLGGPVAGRAFASQETTATPASSVLQNRIERRIHDDSKLKRREVTVFVSDNVVTLTGTVETPEEKARAGRLANVKGIQRVENRLDVDTTLKSRVSGAIDKAAEKTKEGTDKAIDKTKEGIERTKEGTETAFDRTKEGATVATDKTKEGTETAVDKSKEGAEKAKDAAVGGAAVAVDKTSQGVRKAGREVADAFILASVKARMFGQDELKGSDINVDCDAHVVTLKGTVPTEAARIRALEIARKVDGVDRVVDRLTIGPKN